MGSTIGRGKIKAITLDANDALRMAVADKKFAAALVKNPDKFKDVFALRPTEIEAIKAAGLGGHRIPGDVAAYE